MDRMDKINELVKREIGKMLMQGDVSDPRLSFVSITVVKVSRDLRNAKVYFSVLTNSKEDVDNASKGLNSARHHIRKLLGQRVQIRYIPELKFYYDDSIAYADKINRAIDDLHKDDPDSEIVESETKDE